MVTIIFPFVNGGTAGFENRNHTASHKLEDHHRSLDADDSPTASYMNLADHSLTDHMKVLFHLMMASDDSMFCCPWLL